MEKSVLLKLLKQPFHLVSEGVQVAVYSDADQKIVLKILKTFEEGQEQFKKWNRSPLEMKKDWYEHSFESYQFAIKYLKKETGLIDVFPRGLEGARSNLDGVSCDLSQKGFLIQHHAELVKDRIDHYMAHNDIVSAQQVIQNILDFIFSLWARGITEDTFNFHNNYGYLPSGQFIQLDIGSFWFDIHRVKEEMDKKLILKKESFIWLRDAYPSLALFLEQEYEVRYNLFS